MTLATVDRSAESVVAALQQAHTFLSTAVEMTGAADVAMVKTQIAMAETYSRELHLSKEIQTQAQEMVRRAEWSLEQAIRRDREAGVIKGQHSGGGVTVPGMRGSLPRSEAERDDRPSARDFFSNGSERSEVYQIGQASKEEFEAALEAALEDGNVSRANVLRKVKKETGPTTRDQRAELIEELAAQGYTSRQMPAKVGVTEETVRQIAREFGIEIPADRTSVRTRRIDSTRIVTQTATALEGLAMGIELIDYASLDPEEVRQWTDSLTTSINALSKAVKKIKESVQ